MTVVGLDDTDSRERGMCTTYLAVRLALRLREIGTVRRLLLVRLCPAAPHKTRGNAALAVHTDVDPAEAYDIAAELLDESAVTDDPDTHPGLVVAPGAPPAVPSSVVEFARAAVVRLVDLDEAVAIAVDAGYRVRGWKGGRGRIGALAAVGAWSAYDDWTVERLVYREPSRWGTPRDIDEASVFRAASGAYPGAWDTVDQGEGEAVCVPRTPGPVLFGIRGDDTATVDAVAASITGERPANAALFLTNQGTDAHLRPGEIGDLRDGRAYRVDATVASPPETRRGGHVFVDLTTGEDAAVTAAAFEPTKRFRDVVRALRVGDRVTACGEVSEDTLKLEKLAVRSLVRTVPAVPTCSNCGRSMESAGRAQGYRCRECGTAAPGKVERRLERDLERGWYEVPPVARRHVAKPLVRGGFDATIHPER